MVYKWVFSTLLSNLFFQEAFVDTEIGNREFMVRGSVIFGMLTTQFSLRIAWINGTLGTKKTRFMVVTRDENPFAHWADF